MKNEKNVVVKQNCHSRMSLSGIYNACCCKIKGNALLNGCVEDPRYQPSGMTPLFNSGGFTLIELLVVVLIIGILAAVAVPQYQYAVAKSRATQTWVRMNALMKATNLYVLTNGTWPTDVRNLALEIAEDNVTYGVVGLPITGSTNHTGIIYSNGDKCAVFPLFPFKVISCYNGDLALGTTSGSTSRIEWCSAYTRIGEKICKSLSPSGKILGTYDTGFHQWWIVD